MEETNGKEKIALHERLTKVESKTDNLCSDMDILKKDVKEILTNHLPHIQTDVSSTKRIMKVIGGGIGLAILVNVIINLILKLN